MKTPVCAGAAIACSCGAIPGQLMVAPRGLSTSKTQAMATVADSLPIVNIPPFGMCMSPTNPAALLGVPPPCMPQPVGPWRLTSPSTRVLGAPTLTADSTLTCSNGGIISFAQSGQMTIKFPNG